MFKNMWNNIKKVMNIVLIMWTIIVLFIVYRNIEFPFVFEFILAYVVTLLLTFLYIIITIFLFIRKSKWSTIRKMLLNFIIGFFAILALKFLFIYLTKGEFRMMEQLINATILSFFFSFGGSIFEEKN